MPGKQQRQRPRRKRRLLNVSTATARGMFDSRLWSSPKVTTSFLKALQCAIEGVVRAYTRRVIQCRQIQLVLACNA